MSIGSGLLSEENSLVGVGDRRKVIEGKWGDGPADGVIIGGCRQPQLMFLLRFRHVPAVHRRTLSASATSQLRQFKVVLDGQTLYIEKPLAEALGWNPGTSTEGVSLRLSGWEPKFFAITPTETDVGMYSTLVSCPIRKDRRQQAHIVDLLARATVESGKDPRVRQVLSYLRQSDAEP